MTAEDERIKAQERRNRQMASGGVTMPADLVAVTQQVPVATTAPKGNGSLPGQNRSMPSNNRRPMASPISGTPKAHPQTNNTTSAAERTRQRMAEEERLKAQARQGRVTTASVRMPADLMPGATPGGVGAVVTGGQPRQQAPAPVRRGAPNQPPASSPRKTTDQRMREEEELKAAARRARTAQIATNRMPQDLRMEAGQGAPAAVGDNFPSNKRTVVVSHQDIKDQERQARDLVHGTVTAPGAFSPTGRRTTKPVSLPSDLAPNPGHQAPSEEFRRNPTTTTIASHQDVKNQEREVRDLVTGSMTPSKNITNAGKESAGPAAAAAAPVAAAPVSDEVNASNRLAEEERIKQRARQERVSMMNATVASSVQSMAPDLVAPTLEPTATSLSMVSTGSASSSVTSPTSPSSRSSRRTQESDARAKERARRGRVTSSTVVAAASSGVAGSTMAPSRKGDGSMADVMGKSMASMGVAVEEEAAPSVVVGAVSVFTNGVVVQQQRGELTHPPPLPPIVDDEENGRSAPLEGNDVEEAGEKDTENVDKDWRDVGMAEEDVEKPMDPTVTTDAEQTLSAYTPGGDSGVVVTDLQKIDENKDDEVPWYKSSEFRLCFVCVLIAAIAGAVAGIVLSGGGDGGPAPPPTVPPETDSPTLSPTPRPLDAFRVQTARAEIVDGGVTSAAVLDDPSTPQHQAYLWLIQLDQFSWEDFGEGSLLPRYVLATFYYSLGGKSWLSHDGWLDPFVNHCDWEFVGCVSGSSTVGGINTGGRPGVPGLFLGANNMEGSLPSEIVQFSSMTQLRLQGNRITDISALGQGMPVLDFLDLGGAPITDFSAFLAMPAIHTVSIRSSGVGGTIPSELFALSNILSFDVGDNSFTGTLSTELGSFPVLRDAFLAGNNLEGNIGTIFESIQDRSLVRAFMADDNSLTGSLPTIIGDFAPTMIQMTLAALELHGTLPTELGLLTKLERVMLTNNWEIDGTLPSEIGNMDSLRELLLGGTFLEGPIPSEYGNLQDLRWLQLSGTFVDGTTDENLCAIPDLLIESSGDLECTCPGCR